MKHTTILITTVLFLVAFSLNSQESTSLTERLDELEKQNKQLQTEFDDLKRNDESQITTDSNVAIQKDQWGQNLGFEIFAGIHGIYTRTGLGIISPRIANFFSVTGGVVFSSGILNQLFVENNNISKYSTMMINGYLAVRFSSPLLFNFVRLYSEFDFTPGHKFSGTADLGSNVVFGGSGYGGVEFYTAECASFFIQAGGGGIFTLSLDDNKYIVDEGWVGSGFGLKVGGRFYIPKKVK